VLAALGEPPDPALDAALGDDAVRLRAALAARAGEWAVTVATPGLAFATSAVPGARVGGAVPFDEPQPEHVAGALTALLAGHAGPVLLVAPDVPRLDGALAEAALADFAAGCRLAFAPATDARAFLLALANPAPELLALIGARDRRREDVMAAVAELGGELGLLRSERRVVTPGDARALALDPLVPEELRRLAGAPF
jgi:hypothetical protein